MIEFDVDMGYLLEEGELDCVVLNDENGEHEPMAFRQGGGECEVEYVDEWMGWHCKSCDTLWMGMESQKPNFCMRCGRKVKR